MNFCYEYCVRGFYLEGEGMCYERCKIVKQIVDFVEGFLKLVFEEDRKFNSKILSIGSVFEGYRIGKFDEFDYMCELEFLMDEKCEIFLIEDFGFVCV